MKGIYEFEVSNGDLFFKFTIKRNITILKGDSATGKSTLLDLLNTYSSNGSASGVSVKTNANYYVYLGNEADRTWKERIEEKENTIIFIEENNRFIFGKYFAKILKQSGNYFVFVTRNPIGTLSYSTKEIYGLHSYYSEEKLKQVYEFEELYSNTLKINPAFDLIITEDSNAGNSFFKLLYKDYTVLSGGGNASVIRVLQETSEINVLCIVDGAAYGAHIYKIYSYAQRNKERNITIWLPESFEFILLKAGVISFSGLDEILKNPSDYIECKDYLSWERFFTALAQQYGNHYKKKKLPNYYKNDVFIEKVKNIMPKELLTDSSNKATNTIKMNLF